MKLATYKNADGGMEMMNEDSALDEIRALGKVFTAALAERGKASNESDLDGWAGGIHHAGPERARAHAQMPRTDWSCGSSQMKCLHACGRHN
jgi:hypothetical protein